MAEDNLEKAVDAVFDKIKDITYYTSITAKDVILNANKLKMTPGEYLAVVSSYIKDFERSTTNENI